ncbi:hypothetical protein [Halocynthiibacter styelae]|uniref:Uncharacterized protein n=1 Tax=Halocynthiibacter styelae TaxID=2761955 RepID=A0A8J7IZQ7_9RHOB|nr:hypothetical protein [Paenihalocynthiibacter styelae]MBI1495400.1 hypothetical protein [Paenihalocynthiibacter styelae]
MSRLVTLLKAIRDDMKTADLGQTMRDVDITPGQFGADDLERQSFRAPALRIAFLGAPKTDALANETRRYEAALAVFIVTDGADRITDGVAIMEAVAARVELNQFSAGLGIGVPKNHRMQALYSATKSKGVCIHAVAWSQNVQIGEVSDCGGPIDAGTVSGAVTHG